MGGEKYDQRNIYGWLYLGIAFVNCIVNKQWEISIETEST